MSVSSFFAENFRCHLSIFLIFVASKNPGDHFAGVGWGVYFAVMPISPFLAAFFIHFLASASDVCGPLTMSLALRLDITKILSLLEPLR